MITEEPLTHGHTTRHLRSGVTMLILLAIVLGGAFFGWRAVSSESSPEATTTAGPIDGQCGAAPAAVTPPQVQVNVYNGTDRTGLARTTAAQVTQQGFVVLAVDNAPGGELVPGVAIVRGAANSANAYLLLAYVPGATFAADARTDATLDLVVGDAFQAITPPAAPPTPVLVC